MDRSIRYHPLFEQDVTEATDWYDVHLSGLGDRFISAVRSYVQRILDDPERFAVTESGCRYIRIPRFPYVILFDITSKEVLILGVLHTARSPEKWKQRKDSID